jgi:hypothetical protein
MALRRRSLVQTSGVVINIQIAAPAVANCATVAASSTMRPLREGGPQNLSRLFFGIFDAGTI